MTSIQKCEECPLICLNKFNLDETDLNQLNKREIIFNKGETIFKQATFVSHIAIVKKGLLKIYGEGDHNKNIIYKIVGSNDFVGLSFLFNNNYASYSVSALSESTLCLIEKQSIKKLIQKNFFFSEFIHNKIAENMHMLFNKLNQIATKQLHGRLANSIIEIENLEKKGFLIYPYLTKKDLSEYSAMSIESLMRLLNEFKSDKLIIQEGKKILINDHQLLLKLSKVG